MPYWRERVPIWKERDARIKLTDNDKNRIVELHDTGLWSQQARDDTARRTYTAKEERQ